MINLEVYHKYDFVEIRIGNDHWLMMSNVMVNIMSVIG